MLQDKTFQKGLIIIQFLAILLIGLSAVPFGLDMWEWSKIDPTGIWLMEIFFAVLTIIFVVLGIKLMLTKDNKYKNIHLILSLIIAITFIIEFSFVILRMSSVA